MRIAFTGTSSTGKTTLADRLKGDARFNLRVPDFVTTDARAMLRERGHASMDEMSVPDLLAFQRAYLARKLELEHGRGGYVTDRSFVDVAAYWLERDSAAAEAQESQRFVAECRVAAKRYDLHVYFPPGITPFQSDGYRSENAEFHLRINDRIVALLDAWSVNPLVLNSGDIEERVEAVIARLRAGP